MEEAGSSQGFRCVHCGAPVSELYHRYSPQVLKLSKCRQCGQTADPLVEVNGSVVFVDVVLQRLAAYRHLLFNGPLAGHLPRLGLLFLLADAFFHYAQARDAETGSKVPGRGPEELEWRFYGCLLRASAETAALLATALAGLIVAGLPVEELGLAGRALLGSLYGNGLLGLSIVWDLHRPDSPHLLLIRAFIALSHVQVLRAGTSVGGWRVVGVVALAKTLQYLVSLTLHNPTV